MKSNPKLKNTELSGIGGIETWEDAAVFILLGCKNLQMTTSSYRIVEDLCDGLSHYMEKEGVDHLVD
jgi:dihydropyrimidine dehydrogenase (NAD+) subunit PreA